MLKTLTLTILTVMTTMFAFHAQAKGFKRQYVFRYQSQVPSWYSRGDVAWASAVCDQPVQLGQARAGAHCVLIGIYKHITISALQLVVTEGGSQFSTLASFSEGLTSPYQQLRNIFHFVSPSQPLYAVYDLQSNAFRCGVDPKHLIRWNEYGLVN